jgi:glycine betaine/proline transport system substrate-binding protein
MFKNLFVMLLLLGISCKKQDSNAIRPGRATWNTGYFQEALIRKGLEELGYKVKAPKDLANPIFYKSVALGDVDYWANGWFPIHNSQTPKDFSEKAQTVGFVVKAGGLQGYLVSKSAVEKFKIKSLDDFKRPEVKKAFDQNGDGKADLTACPPGWGCEKTISHHMKVYGLEGHVNANKASYEAGMASALGRHSEGKPIFFYTWAPNWTIFKLKPGVDVMWINVPELKPTKAQMPGKDRMQLSGVKGAVTDPIKLGFVISDIQVVANKTFLNKNPKAKKFMELFSLPLQDINEQNTKMNEGEKSKEDIQKHVMNWIKKNQSTWSSWIKSAKAI